MDVTLVAVGKLRPFYREACDEYALRLRRYVTFREVEVREEGREPAMAARQSHEAARIEAKLPEPPATLIALTRHGAPWTSAELARELERWLLAARPVAVMIGGSFGLAPRLLEASTARWSIGALTLPHELARVVVVEQIYRAFTIVRESLTTRGGSMAREWFEEWFGDEYVRLYPHRDEAEADRAVALITEATGMQPGWCVLDLACGAGRHARAFRAAGVRCTGLDLSMTLLRMARTAADVPLVRADMRRLPIRARSMDLTVNLFTSFGYFEREDEHVAALREMASTVRRGGWLVIDFLNPDAVRRNLVPQETVQLDGQAVSIARALSSDGRFVRKTISVPNGRDYFERVRLFSAGEIATMLAAEGVAVRHRFGDYSGGPLTPDAPRTLLLGQVEV